MTIRSRHGAVAALLIALASPAAAADDCSTDFTTSRCMMLTGIAAENECATLAATYERCAKLANGDGRFLSLVHAAGAWGRAWGWAHPRRSPRSEEYKESGRRDAVAVAHGEGVPVWLSGLERLALVRVYGTDAPPPHMLTLSEKRAQAHSR